MKQFDLKNWNDEVFLAYTRQVADPIKTSLIEAGVFYEDEEIVAQFPAQVGGNYAVRPITGLLSGDAIDLDGATNIDDGTLNTYSQGIIAVEMGKSFTEKDFTYSLTGKDFMVQVAEQISRYWQKQSQKKLLSVLKGIFASALAGSVITKTAVASTDIIDAIREVGGDNADLYKVVFMHSVIAKELEKTEKLTFVMQNRADGLQIPTNLAYWNGRFVIVNDQCPVVQNYAKTSDVAIDPSKTYYTLVDGEYVAVETPDVDDIGDYYEATTKTYRTYILGERAFARGDLPVLVPVEMQRDAKTNGGQTSLVSRVKFYLAPEGVSFKKTNALKITNALLETGASWEVVNDGQGHSVEAKNIPFCAIDYTL